MLWLQKEAFRIFDNLSMKGSFFWSSILVRLFYLPDFFRFRWTTNESCFATAWRIRLHIWGFSVLLHVFFSVSKQVEQCRLLVTLKYHRDKQYGESSCLYEGLVWPSCFVHSASITKSNRTDVFKSHLILFLEYCFWTKTVPVVLSPIKYLGNRIIFHLNYM